MPIVSRWYGRLLYQARATSPSRPVGSLQRIAEDVRVGISVFIYQER